MEEKEVKKEKVVKMQPKKNDEQTGKYSYEELNKICAQLSQENQYLVNQIQKANMGNMFRRLDYLFEVIKNASMFDADFVDSCVAEIKEAMTVPAEETEEK